MDDLNTVIQTLIETYFIKRDYRKLLSVLSDDFIFVGMEKNKIAFDIGEIKAHFALELDICNSQFAVCDKWDHIIYITDDVALAIVGMALESNLAMGSVVRMPLRFSVLARREVDGWKVVHIHNSMPYGARDRHSNHGGARESDRRLNREAHSISAGADSTVLAELAPAALESREFKLYIQPQVDLRTLQPVAGEALVRWVQRDGTVIMPDDFIPLFEENRFIIPFDFYMLHQLCANMRRWMDREIALRPISINQSRLNLLDRTYIDRFCKVVDQYAIPHKYIAFELTESAFIKNNGAMLALARELHRRGFGLDIDDFGAGYASLNLLSLVDADVLKIDRSLLDGIASSPRSRIVLRKVIEMARECRMTTICEGVETDDQLSYLRKLGCDMGQGYLFYHPMPVEAFEEELLHQKPDLIHL